MAKHDQRILKFLNQNADRAPTITEMMTRLNISISDISESLTSLQSQGLISKKTNNQGIECWFPTSSQATQPIPAAAMGGHQVSDRILPQAAPLAAPTAQFAAVGGPIPDGRNPVEVRSGLDSRFLGGHNDRSMAAPEPQPPMARPIAEREAQPRPVQVQHIAAEQNYAPRGLDASSRNELPNVPPPMMNGAGMYGLAPARSGVGLLTLLAGLVAAVALSSFITTRLIAKEFKKASANFVDRKALTDANAALAEFQEKTKAHVTALEADLKKVTEELAAAKASAESSKVAAAAPAPAAAAKGPAAKAAPKAEAKTAEAKPAKSKKSVAAAKPKSSGMTAMAKAAARGAAMRKKAAARAAADAGPSSSSDESSEPSASGSSSESPSVPNPPGLEELPPPPSE
jgi:hypothetical protein